MPRVAQLVSGRVHLTPCQFSFHQKRISLHLLLILGGTLDSPYFSNSPCKLAMVEKSKANKTILVQYDSSVREVPVHMQILWPCDLFCCRLIEWKYRLVFEFSLKVLRWNSRSKFSLGKQAYSKLQRIHTCNLSSKNYNGFFE